MLRKSWHSLYFLVNGFLNCFAHRETRNGMTAILASFHYLYILGISQRNTGIGKISLRCYLPFHLCICQALLFKRCWISSGTFGSIQHQLILCLRYFVLSFLKVNICFTWVFSQLMQQFLVICLLSSRPAEVNIWTPLSKIWNLVASFTKLLKCTDAEKKSLYYWAFSN